MNTNVSSFPRIQSLSRRLKVSFSFSWILILPPSLWAIATLYVPILNATANGSMAWIAASLIAGLVAASAIGHTLAHVAVARLARCVLPERISIFVFGDAAQVWPAAPTAGREVLVAVAGPLANLVLFGIGYLVWNAQVNPILNLTMPFFGLFNLWMAIVNLTPGFPLDGGRLVRAILWGWLSHPAGGVRGSLRLGFGITAVLAAWGVFLFAQGTRFSLDTSILTSAFALLLVLALVRQKAWQWSVPEEGVPQNPRPRFTLVSAILICGLLAAPANLLLTNHGLEAPGVALSVEPMVEIPGQYRHPHAGTFILTTVLQQTPIPVGAWLVAKLDPAYKILPPERNQPNQPSPQQAARQGFQMLDQSETTALVVGMRLAGYPAAITSKGVRVSSILPDSPSQNFLMIGDVIRSLNGTTILTIPQLIQLVQSQKEHTVVHLNLLRGKQSLEFTIPLMSPASPGGPPRLGITIESAGFNYKLPIPVKIVPQKIVGGPSAGLMFTLTVYNLLSPTDLTEGRRIAGTGTINPDGSVGPIGGVEQKVAAAEAAGAGYFLSPPENYADALAAARHIQVIEVKNVDQAIAFLRSLPSN